MSPADHENRVRAEAFGAVADQYDQSRPSYPSTLIDDLLAADPVDILDIGCGTGRAARLLVGPGRRVLGVEPDPRMAERARGHGIDVEVAAFEGWADAGRRFDLLTSAQAWHWVDPEAGAARAAEVLRPGGRFAAFWNETRHTPEARAVFDDVYRRHAPDLLETSVTLGVGTTIGARADRAGAALAAGPFDVVEAGGRRRYPWQAEYTPEEWITLVGTHSDHLGLDPAVRVALLDDLEAALRRLGPTFVVPYRTDLLLAVRR